MYLFVHIPKTGGMSIRKAMGEKLVLSGPGTHVGAWYTERVLRTMKRHGLHHCIGHCRWRDFSVQLRKKLKAVSVVRNPWSRTVSRYTWARQEGDTPPMSFRRFLEMRHEWAGKEYFWHSSTFGWFQQKDYVTDERGNLRCDILRHMRLSQDAQRYFRVPVGKENVSNSKDYRTFYGPAEYDIVADWYREDIEFFGFGFDTPATKNTLYS